MENFCYGKALREIGVSYLGDANHSAKMHLSYINGTLTYCLYLAPYDLSGYLVCPNAKYCKDFCLNESGRAKTETFANGKNVLHMARIKKTRLFFEHRDVFMACLIHELRRFKRKAENLGMGFSVRLNGTSDLSPVLFKDPESGLNILELFDNVQFYDYTKVFPRVKLIERYPNYDLTFSYNGHNAEECEKFINGGGKVAVVFYGKELPKRFCGYDVVDGNLYDMRYIDPNGTVVGLHYHVTSRDYQTDLNGKRRFVIPNTPFVVMPNDPRCEW